MFVMAVMTLLSSATGAGYSGKVLLVSMDGFRWDYIKKVSGLGNFTRLRTSGATVDYVNPGFATKTFPSHYSIVTGLYEEDHGIVGNNMWDPERNAAFDKYSTESFWWDEGEPVWVTAVRQNKRAGVYYWPGTGAEIRGYRPTVWIPWLYTQTAPFPDRVQTALRWFTDNNTDLVLLHFHEPDSTGHVYGPDSSELADKVREMDAVLGLILNGLETRGLDDVVNVIVTSDHGMAYVDMPNNLIDLWAVIDPTMVDRVAESGTLTAILPAEGREEDVVKALKNNSHVTVYRKEEIPEHFHYKHNPRIMPVIVQAQEGWILSANVTVTKSRAGKGNHGYSHDLPSQKPIFFARAPNFCKGVKSISIRTVDIYPLICHLLDITPAPNNGTLDNTAHFLLSSHVAARNPDRTLVLFLTSAAILLLF